MVVKLRVEGSLTYTNPIAKGEKREEEEANRKSHVFHLAFLTRVVRWPFIELKEANDALRKVSEYLEGP